jgi:hypothetical protein
MVAPFDRGAAASGPAAGPRQEQTSLFCTRAARPPASRPSLCSSPPAPLPLHPAPSTLSPLQGFEGPDSLADALKGCDLVIIPAGVPRKPGMTRDDLFKVPGGGGGRGGVRGRGEGGLEPEGPPATSPLALAKRHGASEAAPAPGRQGSSGSPGAYCGHAPAQTPPALAPTPTPHPHLDPNLNPIPRSTQAS